MHVNIYAHEKPYGFFMSCAVWKDMVITMTVCVCVRKILGKLQHWYLQRATGRLQIMQGSKLLYELTCQYNVVVSTVARI